MTFRLAGGTLRRARCCSVRSTSQASSVPRAPRRRRPARSSAARRNACGVWIAHSRERSSVAVTIRSSARPPSRCRCRARRRPRSRRRPARRAPPGSGRPSRAVAPHRGRRRRRAARRRAPRGPTRARSAARHDGHVRPEPEFVARGYIGRRRVTTTVDRGGAQGLERPSEHRATGQNPRTPWAFRRQGVHRFRRPRERDRHLRVAARLPGCGRQLLVQRWSRSSR